MFCRACGADIPDDSGYVCPSCGRHPGTPEDNEGEFIMAEGSGGQGPAFESRETLGFMPSFWMTVKGVLLSPTATFSDFKRSGLEGAILFALTAGAIGGLFGGIWNVFLQGVFAAIGGALGTGGNSQALATMGVGVLIIPFTAVAGCIGALISMFLYGGLSHLVLMAFKADRHGFEATARAAGYVQAIGLLNVIPLFMIPIIGPLASFAWFAVALTIAVREVQETDTMTAVAAVLGPFVLCCFCIFVPLFAIGFGAAFKTSGM